MLKFFFTSATAFLFCFTAQAANFKGTDLHLEGKTIHAQADQYYRYDFGSTSRNFPVYRDFYLRNDGPGDLIVHQIAVSGGNFFASHNCPTYLPSGYSCTMRVGFQPWNEGFSTGRMYVDTSSGLITIDLTGYGTNY